MTRQTRRQQKSTTMLISLASIFVFLSTCFAQVDVRTLCVHVFNDPQHVNFASVPFAWPNVESGRVVAHAWVLNGNLEKPDLAYVSVRVAPQALDPTLVATPAVVCDKMFSDALEPTSTASEEQNATMFINLERKYAGGANGAVSALVLSRGLEVACIRSPCLARRTHQCISSFN